jgi:hypothetical protein
MKAANWSPLLVALLLVGLWPAAAGAKSNPNRIREKAEEFTASWLEADFKHRMQAKEAKYDRVLKDFGYLFSPSKISDLGDEKEKTSDLDEIRALTMLSQFIEQNIVLSAIAASYDDRANFELEEEVDVGSGTVPMWQVRAMVRGEPDRKQRKLAYVTLADKYTITNVYKNQIIATINDALEPLAYGSYIAMRSTHQGIDYDKLKSYCEQILEETAPSYEAGLEERAEKVLDVGFSKVRRYDLEFLTMSTEMDEALKKQDGEKIWRPLQKNLDLASWRKILKLDMKDDKKRYPWPEMYDYDQVEEIVLAGREYGATANLATELQFFGRFQRVLNLTTEQWEFRRCQSRALDLAAGYLFEGLLAEPQFTTDVLGLSDAQAEELKRSRQFAALTQLRLDAASFLFQLVLHEDFKMAQPKFNDMMEQYLKVKFLTIDSELYLEDFRFFAAERLVARKLAAQMREALVSRFGDGWWNLEQAGEFLKTMWADGSRRTYEELSATQGFALYDTTTLVEQLIAAGDS